ncbi:hypothetical protein U9M48_040800 [Paspalum notatum var. saurae]|uniref:F-box domain-containing protein n=1 Tax=Paspalum notatum var. saurae TaxID=547442 RepID=A0AAQ3ULW7_PASNO
MALMLVPYQHGRAVLWTVPNSPPEVQRREGPAAVDQVTENRGWRMPPARQPRVPSRPPARRPRVPSRPPATSSAAAADDPRGDRGWLSTFRRDPTRRPRQADGGGGGTALADELLLLIFTRLPDLSDLVRCTATCRRWRRLVSGDAAFICRTPRRPPGRFVGGFALGFFQPLADAAPRFVALASAARRFPGLLRQPAPSLSSLVDGGLFDGSPHIVAARNGLLVVDLRRGKHDRTPRLCVCNPMTGDVHVLPPLGGKDGLGHYACAVVTADDLDDKSAGLLPPPGPSYFRLVMVYTRRGFTAFRSYSSSDGSWSEEAKVTNGRLGKKQMGMTHSGVVLHGGRVVCWLAKNIVFRLCLDTRQSTVLSMPCSGNTRTFDMANTLLGSLPDGKLCAVQFDRHPSLAAAKRRVSIRTASYIEGTCWRCEAEPIQVEQYLPADVTYVRLRWFCDKSGVVFFSALAGDIGPPRRELYALSLQTWAVEKLASHDGDGIPWVDLHGYEMNQVAYLASLVEADGLEDE